jgi:hypothetical protein
MDSELLVKAIVDKARYLRSPIVLGGRMAHQVEVYL